MPQLLFFTCVCRTVENKSNKINVFLFKKNNNSVISLFSTARKYFSSVHQIPESESNRLFLVRVRFGSSFFLKVGSSSVRFDFIFEKLIRVRFGSVRLNFQEGGSSSVQIDSNRTEPFQFGSFSLSVRYM